MAYRIDIEQPGTVPGCVHGTGNWDELPGGYWRPRYQCRLCDQIEMEVYGLPGSGLVETATAAAELVSGSDRSAGPQEIDSDHLPRRAAA